MSASAEIKVVVSFLVKPKSCLLFKKKVTVCYLPGEKTPSFNAKSHPHRTEKKEKGNGRDREIQS